MSRQVALGAIVGFVVAVLVLSLRGHSGEPTGPVEDAGAPRAVMLGGKRLRERLPMNEQVLNKIPILERATLQPVAPIDGGSP